MSISMALLELTEEITSALDENKCIIGVFIDLKKALTQPATKKNLKFMALEVLPITG